jgi:hypothetical protein
MTNRIQADQLLAGVAEILDRPDFRLQPEGAQTGALVTELDGIPFSFHYDEGFDALFIQCACGSVHEAPEKVLEQALAANYFWGATAGGILGLDEESRLILSYRLDLPLELSPEEEQALLPELLAHLSGAARWAADLVPRARGQLSPED